MSRTSNIIYFVVRKTFGLIVKLLWIEKIEGKGHIPRKGPAIIAANHSSHLDFAFLMVASKRRLYFLAGEHIYKSKLGKWLMDFSGQIKVDRNSQDKRHVYLSASDVLKRGDLLALFPEGKRSFSGITEKAYKGVAKIALENKADIIPTVIDGSYHIFGRHHRRPRFKRICKVKFLEPIKHEDIEGRSPEEIVHNLLMPEIAKELGHEYAHRLIK